MAEQGGILAGKAFVELYLKGDIEGQLKSLQKRLSTFGKTIAGLGAKVGGAGLGLLAPLALATSQFDNLGDQVGKASQRTGVAVEALSALKYAADQSGSSLDGLETAFKFLAKNELSGKAAGALDAIHVSAQDLIGLSPDQKFLKIADALSRVSDTATRGALAMELFGKQGVGLLPLIADGAAGITALTDRARRLGLTFDKDASDAATRFGDILGDLKAQLQAVEFQVGGIVARALQPFADVLANQVLPRVIAFVKENHGLVLGVLATGAALAVAGGALIAVGGSISLAGAAIGGLLSAVRLVGSGLTLLANVVALPFTLAASAIGTVGGLFVSVFSGLASVIAVPFELLGTLAVGSFGLLVSVATAAVGVVGGLIGGLAGVAVSAVGGLAGLLVSAVGGVIGLVGSILTGVVGLVGAAIGVAVGAVGLAVSALGTIFTVAVALPGIIAEVSALITLVGALAAALAAVDVELLLPVAPLVAVAVGVGVILAAIVAIPAVAGLIGKAIGSVAAKIGTVLSAVGSAFKSAVGFVVGGFQTVLSVAKQAVAYVVDGLRSAYGYAVRAGTFVFDLTIRGFHAIMAVAREAWTATLAFAKSAYDGTVAVARSAAQAIGDGFANLGTYIKGVFDYIQKVAVDAFGGIANAVKVGDIQLAAKIAFTALKLAFLEGTAGLILTWYDFKAQFVKLSLSGFYAVLEAYQTFKATLLSEVTQTMATLADLWDKVVKFIMDAWQSGVNFIMDQWHDGVDFVLKLMVKIGDVWDSVCGYFSDAWLDAIAVVRKALFDLAALTQKLDPFAPAVNITQLNRGLDADAADAKKAQHAATAAAAAVRTGTLNGVIAGNAKDTAAQKAKEKQEGTDKGSRDKADGERSAQRHADADAEVKRIEARRDKAVGDLERQKKDVIASAIPPGEKAAKLADIQKQENDLFGLLGHLIAKAQAKADAGKGDAGNPTPAEKLTPAEAKQRIAEFQQQIQDVRVQKRRELASDDKAVVKKAKVGAFDGQIGNIRDRIKDVMNGGVGSGKKVGYDVASVGAQSRSAGIFNASAVQALQGGGDFQQQIAKNTVLAVGTLKEIAKDIARIERNGGAAFA